MTAHRFSRIASLAVAAALVVSTTACSGDPEPTDSTEPTTTAPETSAPAEPATTEPESTEPATTEPATSQPAKEQGQLPDPAEGMHWMQVDSVAVQVPTTYKIAALHEIKGSTADDKAVKAMAKEVGLDAQVLVDAANTMDILAIAPRKNGFANNINMILQPVTAELPADEIRSQLKTVGATNLKDVPCDAGDACLRTSYILEQQGVKIAGDQMIVSGPSATAIISASTLKPADSTKLMDDIAESAQLS